MTYTEAARREIAPVRQLTATGEIGRIVLEWEHDPYLPLVDHYAVYVDGSTSPVAKTVYPVFRDGLLGPSVVQRSYRVVAIDDAGRRSAAREVSGESKPSAATGRALWTIGSFDYKSLELALAPNGYSRFTATFGNGPDFTVGSGDPATGWSYIHPGPADSWAGRTQHRATVRFVLDAVPETDPTLAIWLIDTHATIPGIARIGLGGSQIAELKFEPGATRGSLEGDATAPRSPLVPSLKEFAIPRTALVAGENVLTIDKVDGSWHVYDGLGLFVPR